MGRPKPGATIEIGNQRRIPAIRKTQKTEAEDHEMQHGQAAFSKEEANQSEWEERRKKDFRACKQQATTAFQPHRTAA